jgi:hypothetical protein
VEMGLRAGSQGRDGVVVVEPAQACPELCEGAHLRFVCDGKGFSPAPIWVRARQ